ncbi:MAG: hypothetical protein M0P57_02090 [Syntrophales bacterium]|nr:hypothetical protein [Syntrophales bacterium]
MIADEYEKAKVTAQEIAATFEPPLFYREKKIECVQSGNTFEENHTAQACLLILKDKKASYGHGLSHAVKVAVDAGAIIIVEGFSKYRSQDAKRLLFLAHIAGVLHDIERSSPNHAQKGSMEAEKILLRFDLSPAEIEAVTGAIRNHEAFQPYTMMKDPAAQLLSDALYDADKFRWGPDNYTEMIWDILAPRKVPVAKLMERFLPGLEGIKKIRDTFRTETGKKYGPDFIDRGIEIGLELYKRLGGTLAV